MANAVRSLFEEYWEWFLRKNPVFATNIGDDRYNDRLPESGPEARERSLAEIRAFLEKLGALVPDEADRVSYRVLRHRLELAVQEHAQRLDHFSVDPLFGPQVAVGLLHVHHPFRNAKDVRDLIARYAAFEALIAGEIESLREGAAEGRTAPAILRDRVVQQVERMLSTRPAECPLVRPVEKKFSGIAGADALRRELIRTVEKKVYPAFRRYGDFLKALSPRRGPGISSVPGGAEAYRCWIRRHTTLDLSAGEIHRIGMEEIESIRREMSAIAKRMGFDGGVSGFIPWMMSRPEHFGLTGERLLREAERMLEQCKAKLPGAFGRLPKLDCVVRPIEAFRARDAVAAFYHPGAVRTGRPGVFYVNTWQAEKRPRFNLKALTVHEAVPGHHLERALANEAAEVPMFRRHGGVTAFVEGWALYAERLAEELELYDSDAERFGMLTYQVWRAARLVVDTGLHAMGWSRRKAIDFMKETVALSETEIVNEVDRYIAWPGQALAYKIGQREIERIRGEAEAKLAGRFNLRKFHDRLLGIGAVPLPVLSEEVGRNDPEP